MAYYPAIPYRAVQIDDPSFDFMVHAKNLDDARRAISKKRGFEGDEFTIYEGKLKSIHVEGITVPRTRWLFDKECGEFRFGYNGKRYWKSKKGTRYEINTSTGKLKRRH